MNHDGLSEADYLPAMPSRRDWGIGVVGAGFIVRDCHLVAYAEAGFRVVGLTSRSPDRAREVARLRGIPAVYDSLEQMLEDPQVEVIDVAVPPLAQPQVIRRILDHPRAVRGILAQKPLAMSPGEALSLVEGCERCGIALQVNQNMRYDHSVRALRSLIEREVLGEPVLATIEMRAIPHWMPWASEGSSLSTYIMSIHHLDTFRYWLGEPSWVVASTRPDPRTRFRHDDGINLYILEFDNGARAAAWDDVWTGPAREGAAADLGIRWRFEGTEGVARGTIGWPGWPDRVPSTLDYSTRGDQGQWRSPRWPQAWFPDAFAGPMASLLRALESGTLPEISGRDNLRTITLCEAVLVSAREHRAVRSWELAPFVEQD